MFGKNPNRGSGEGGRVLIGAANLNAFFHFLHSGVAAHPTVAVWAQGRLPWFLPRRRPSNARIPPGAGER